MLALQPLKRSLVSMRMRRTIVSSEANETEQVSEGEQLIWDKLHTALSPERLRVADISGGCGSMYAIDIASKEFKGLSMIKQHRKVNEILKDEIKLMHGLQLKTSTP